MYIFLRADDETRTRDPHLGKVMRYQLRYIRKTSSLNRAHLANLGKTQHYAALDNVMGGAINCTASANRSICYNNCITFGEVCQVERDTPPHLTRAGKVCYNVCIGISLPDSRIGAYVSLRKIKQWLSGRGVVRVSLTVMPS